MLEELREESRPLRRSTWTRLQPLLHHNNLLSHQDHHNGEIEQGRRCLRLQPCQEEPRLLLRAQSDPPGLRTRREVGLNHSLLHASQPDFNLHGCWLVLTEELDLKHQLNFQCNLIEMGFCNSRQTEEENYSSAQNYYCRSRKENYQAED